MKELNIEWRHLEEKGETCIRCSDTGKTLTQVISELSDEFLSKDIIINFKETKLSKNDIVQSNIILFNGIPIEDILTDNLLIIENSCPSCSTLIGESTCCRAIKYENNIYEAVPEELIRKALFKIVGSQGDVSQNSQGDVSQKKGRKRIKQAHKWHN